MVFNKIQESFKLAPQQSSDKFGSQCSLKRPFIALTTVSLATVSMALVGIAAIVPSALSQSSASSQAVARSSSDAAVQRSTCANDPQGLMCSSSQREATGVATAQSPPRTTSAAPLPALSDAQMERLSDVLLGLLYFALPIGFGLTLFLRDRYEAYRAATLEAQIKLLEKLWEQSPQA